MASLVFFIKKKNGSLHLIQEYHKLNAMTMKNSYPYPLSLTSSTVCPKPR